MTSFAPANQFGNSWASAYVPREKVQAKDDDKPLDYLDYSYVLNEALWDGWFFSGAAPTLTHSSRSGDAAVWDQTVAGISRPVTGVLRDFMDDPIAKPLRNPRWCRPASRRIRAISPRCWRNPPAASRSRPN